jgi:hypothetical protein
MTAMSSAWELDKSRLKDRRKHSTIEASCVNRQPWDEASRVNIGVKRFSHVCREDAPF